MAKSRSYFRNGRQNGRQKQISTAKVKKMAGEIL
jgi:hypothetical protein